jgi:hypothetical protein
MAYPGGRAVFAVDPEDRRDMAGRFAEGPWSIESASGGSRGYARHARSMTARNARQRVLAVALAGTVIVTVAVLAAPRAVRMFSAPPGGPLQTGVAVRERAAAWVARWVSHSAWIACDRVMCSTLRADGVPQDQFVPINTGTPDPVGSDVVVETAVVRNLFRHRLGSVYAPAVLARFGSGGARIEVRVVDSNGGALRFERKLRAGVRARKLAGRELLINQNIATSPAAARQLAAGRVDPRILETLSVLANELPLTVLAFGGAGPGASRGMPRLSVDVTAGDCANGNSAVSASWARVETPVWLAGVLELLRAQIAPRQPARYHEITSRNGLTFVRIDYAAPSPLTMFTGSA